MAKRKNREPFGPEDRPWTEEEWERFIAHDEARSAKFGELFETLMDHPDREAIIDREMGWDQPDDEAEDDDEELPPVEDIEPPTDEEMVEWLREREEALQAIPAYTRGCDYGLKVYWALKPYMEKQDMDDPDEDLVTAYSDSRVIATKIAGGHAMGYTDDTLGGNIVKCKRSLAAANKCLEAMALVKARGLVPAEVMDPLIAEGKEVRALVEQHIAELRKRVWWG